MLSYTVTISRVVNMACVNSDKLTFIIMYAQIGITDINISRQLTVLSELS